MAKTWKTLGAPHKSYFLRAEIRTQGTEKKVIDASNESERLRTYQNENADRRPRTEGSSDNKFRQSVLKKPLYKIATLVCYPKWPGQMNYLEQWGVQLLFNLRL